MKKSFTKKILLLTLTTLVLIVMPLAGCGGSASSESAGQADSAETTAAAAEEVKGEMIENDKFSMIVADGWEQMELSGAAGFQVYKGNDVIQVKVSGMNVTEEEDKTLLENMKEQYGGTDLEEVSMLGMKFYKTSFTASGVDQTIYSGVRNGEQVSIQMAGKDHQNNKDIKAMFESIKLK